MPHYVSKYLKFVGDQDNTPVMQQLETENGQTVVKYIDYRMWLQKEFSSRVRNNSRYSLRSFSKLLKMDASSVSQILSGKRKASTKALNKMFEALGTPHEKRALILAGLHVHKSIPTYMEVPVYESISSESFSAVSDWYHAAILELTFVKGLKVNKQSVSKTLKISEVEASFALERLKNLNLLQEKNDSYFKKDFFLSNESAPGVTSFGHKEFQRQLIQKALVSIDETPQDEKDITSIVMAIDPEKIPLARQMIKKFRRELCAFLEQGERTQVYNLGIQLHPLSARHENIDLGVNE